MTHNFDPTTLREYDIRGVIGKMLGEADARAIGRGFATRVRRNGGKRVAVGYDGRLSSPALEAALVEGLRASGVDVVRSVLGDPLYWIASNAGYDGDEVVAHVREMPPGHGLNALTGNYGDLIADGVIDPVRVTRLSLQHAASVAALLLTTEALVAEELIGQPGAIPSHEIGDLAEGMARPSSPV